MIRFFSRYLPFVFTACFILLLVAGCGAQPTVTPTVTPSPEATFTPEPTLTPTPPPSVAIVNGVYIPEEDLAREIANLRAADELVGSGNGNVRDEETLRADALALLTDEALLVAYARYHGYVSDEAALSDRINRLIESVGGEGNFQGWKQASHYSDDGFRRALDHELAIGYAREKILAERMSNLEQIHAFQVLTDSQSKAQKILDELAMGFDFITLARTADTITGGDLDWVARGILVYPELEEALFALEPGQATSILETELGFHILYAAEKSSDRPLSEQSRQIIEHRILTAWLEDARNGADIQNLK